MTVDGRGENTILRLIDAARNFDPIAETPIDAWIMPGTSSSCRAICVRASRGTVLLCEVEGRDDGSHPSPTYAARDYDWILVDLVLVNRGEAIELAGGGAEEAARTLCKKGAGAVVLTLGAEGAAFFSADDAFRISAPRVTAIDAVGAGDVFCGVLIAAKVLGLGWRDALAAATEAASASVEAKGGARFLSVPGGDGGHS